MIDRKEYRALLRSDLGVFSERAFMHLNTAVDYMPNWHIDLIAAKIQDAITGGSRRIIVTLPPRHLKSHIASVAAPAFLLGIQPTARIMCVSYAQELAHALALQSRAVMESPWYRALFPTRISSTKNAVAEYHTIQGGCRLSISVGGALTGRGADVIIIDDPIKPGDVISDVMRDNVNEWYRRTLYNRQNNKNESVIIIIMQRLHEDDLVGHVQRLESWDVINLPAIATQDETFEVMTPMGLRQFQRSEGGVLHPARENEETLAIIKANMGEYDFAAQYQQMPSPAGGGMVRIHWFGRYDTSPCFDYFIQSWDTANKPSDLADYSVCTTWGIKDRKVYLVDVYRERLDYPALKKKVRELRELFKPKHLLIEDKASGTQLIQELVQEGIWEIKRVTPSGNKVMRMHAQTAAIENGIIFLPRKAFWLDAYTHELAIFPNGRYDDQVDSTSQALEFIKGAVNEPGAVTFYRSELAKMGRYT